MTKDAKKLRCSDCGKAPADGKLNRRGRCHGCGIDVMVFAMQVNMLAGDLTTKQRGELRKLLAKFAPKEAPAKWAFDAQRAGEFYAAGVAHPRAAPSRHRKAPK